MSAQRYLTRLRDAQITHAEASLKPNPDDKSEFGYGKAIGLQMGLKLAQELYETVLNEQEEPDGSDRHATHRRR